MKIFIRKPKSSFLKGFWPKKISLNFHLDTYHSALGQEIALVNWNALSIYSVIFFFQIERYQHKTLINPRLYDVSGQKYAMNQMKTVISTVLRKMRIETLGSREDIQISMQLLIRIESLPNVKFHKIWLLKSLGYCIVQNTI